MNDILFNEWNTFKTQLNMDKLKEVGCKTDPIISESF